MVDIVVASQVKEVDEIDSDHYSPTGNSWNQDDVDNAYNKYYSSMPAFPKDSEKDAKSKKKSVYSYEDDLQAHPLLVAQTPDPEEQGEQSVGGGSHGPQDVTAQRNDQNLISMD